MLTEKIIKEFESLLPNKISFSLPELNKHASNQFYVSSQFPDLICYPESDEDVLSIVNFCVKNKVPIIPYGSGTSVEGHTAALHGGVCVDMSKMNQVLELNVIDGFVRVRPGISYNQLNEFLDPHDFHFPVEAGWGASIGGMVSTNASGAGAVDAGSMAKNVMACNVVVYKNETAEKVAVGSKAPKSSAGYNLLNLYIGAEGTLGIITEVCLKICKNFNYYKTVCCQFDEIHEAINFIANIKGKVQFRKAELLDKLQTEVCVRYSNIKTLYPNKNTILIELAGNEIALAEEVNIITEYLNKNHVEYLKVYEDKKSADNIWMMRKNACPAAIKFINKDKKAMATDISVPLSKLADCIYSCYEKMKTLGIIAPLVAHVGDGNFHFTVLVDPSNPEEVSKAKEFNKSIIEEALKVGGTCTGEHGIGIGKMSYLKMEHADTIFLLESIKLAIDPLNIFNPGKIVNVANKLNCVEDAQPYSLNRLSL